MLWTNHFVEAKGWNVKAEEHPTVCIALGQNSIIDTLRLYRLNRENLKFTLSDKQREKMLKHFLVKRQIELNMLKFQPKKQESEYNE